MEPTTEGDQTAEGIEVEPALEGDASFDELDETRDDDAEPVTDGEMQTDDEMDGDDLVIVNPGAGQGSGEGTPKSRKSTPLKKMLSGAGSLRSGFGSKSGSRAGSKSGSKGGSRRGSDAGSGRASKAGSVQGSKAGSRVASQVASPAISSGSRKDEKVLIRVNSPAPSNSGVKELRRPSSLPVLHEEADEYHVSFTPHVESSRRPSVHLGVSRSQTPSHGILKTPDRSSPATPSKFLNLNDEFRVDIEQTFGNAAAQIEEGLNNNLANLNEIGGTPLQRMRSRANSLLNSIAGSRLASRAQSRAQSRAASRLGSPKATGTPRKDAQGEALSVDKTLELAADALVEHSEGKDEANDKPVADGAAKPGEPAAADGDPNATGKNNNNNKDNNFKDIIYAVSQNASNLSQVLGKCSIQLSDLSN